MIKSIIQKKWLKNRQVEGKRVGLGSLFLLYSICCFPQEHDYNWIFSSRWPDSISLITFHSQAKHSYQRNPDEYRYSSTNAMISNHSGLLAFSTNGCNVLDAEQRVMENGLGINEGEVHDMKCNPRGYTAGHQSAIVLPNLDNENLYYLFHHSIIFDLDDTLDRIKTDALRYTIIDMSDNGGTGSVLIKNVPIVSDTTLYAGSITAVRHANNEDWWLISPHRYDSAYYKVRISPDSIHEPQIQKIGKLAQRHSELGGGAQFTPDGSKYIRWNASDGIYIMDFDRATGELSHFQWIDHRIDTILFVGLAVSPNSRFLYTGADYAFYQYDLWADDLLASRELIAIYDGFNSPGPCTFWAGQLGPDCKIYFNSKGSCSWLHVIHRPNEKGKACDFRPHQFSIKSNHHGTMPHFPNYRLGVGEPCDSTLVATTEVIPTLKGPSVKVVPNPHSGLFQVDASFDFDNIEVYNMSGKRILATTDLEISLANQPDGVYQLTFRKDEKVVSSSRCIKMTQ